MIYASVSTHPILSGEAISLTAENTAQFGAHQQLAELLLGFTAPAVTDATLLANAQLALALQINWQLATKLDPYIYASQGSAKLSGQKAYKDGVPLVSEQAQAVADTVLVPTVEDEAARWGSLRSLRGPQR